MSGSVEWAAERWKRDERFHWLLLCALLVAGALIRFWRIDQCGLSMWDESVYVRSGQWFATLGQQGRPHGADFAPALYPFYLGLFFVIFGFRDSVAVASSATASFATLGAVYLLGRRLFGPPAALVAVAFLAANLFNIFFARQAMTDASFQLLFVLALHALHVWVQEGRRSWLLLSGLALGLCEHVKYHAFFAWLIVAASYSWGGVRGPIPWPLAVRRLLQAGLVAFVIFLPWLVLIAHRYGLGWMVHHYLAYSIGASGHRGTLSYLWTCLSEWCGPTFLLMSASGLAIAAWQRRRGDIIVLIWLGLFAAGSLLYMAYPRLLLPMTSGLALLAGRTAGTIGARYPARRTLVALCCAALLSEVIHARGRMGPFGGGYRAAGAYLAAQIPSGALAAGTVAPILWHYSGFEAPDLSAEAVRDRLRRGEPVYFATDLVLNRKPASRALMLRNQGRFRLARTFENPVSEPEILSSLEPEEFREFLRRPGDARWDDIRQIRVYQVTGPWDLPVQGR